MNTPQKLTFIGAGNMARAIIGGLIDTGYPTSCINACEPDVSRIQDLQAKGINISADNAEFIDETDIIILAVKPQVLGEVTRAIAAQVQEHKPLIMSVAAGLTANTIEQWLGGQLAIVRCMPNTPALVQTGASGLYANPNVTGEQKSAAEKILAAVGLSTWVEEEAQLDAVTAVSGSGPAYYFMFMEAMIEAGIAQGLSPETAKALTLQTALGAAKMASESEHDPAELRRRVTSPNGTTEQAILSFTNDQLPSIVQRAMDACKHRSEELAKELGKA